MKIILTGAGGFVGSHLLNHLDKYAVSAIGRNCPRSIAEEAFHVLNIDGKTDYRKALKGGDVVIHCAARAHIMHDEALDPLLEYREVNTLGTLNLARQAAEAGIKRFIYISSIKVNGETTCLDNPFTEVAEGRPVDPYSLSKFEAELGLGDIRRATDLEVVIIRPPLIYGAGVKANFSSLLELVSKNLPLPFGGITLNRRSLVSVENLVDLIVTCIEHPKAANDTFLVSDDDDFSTAELFKHLRMAFGQSSYLLPFPQLVFKVVCTCTGKSDIYDRLCGSLQLDITHTMDALGWQPPYTTEEGFDLMVRYYLKSKK